MNEFPDIDIINREYNPTLASPNSPFTLQFYQTRETLFDSDVYKQFLDNGIMKARHSAFYKKYKGFLIGLGMDHCQFLGNINDEMATIEMHHVIPMQDIALIISEHILNTIGMISTFDLSYLIKQEHKQHHIQLVMLALTPHQIYHDNLGMYIAPGMTIGNWPEFLKKYRYGITQDIAFKLLMYINQAIDEDKSNDNSLLELRDTINDWSCYNNNYFN